MHVAMDEGGYEEAREIHERLLPLSSAMFIDTNPVPVKAALAMMGLIGTELRLPLVELSSANKKRP